MAGGLMEGGKADAARALGATPLEYEIAQEKAGSLRRAADALDRALAALKAHDDTRSADPARDSEPDAAHRAGLRAEACERLWFFIVQREMCGMRRHGDVFELHQVPHEVRRLMGPKPGPSRPAPDHAD